jgi:hypothetical protein
VPGDQPGVLGGVPCEEVPEDDVLLRSAEQPRRGVAPQGRRLPQDPEAEGLVGARQGLGRGASQTSRDALAQAAGADA